MRKLKTSDIFKMSKILKKINLKLEDTKDKSEKQVGMEFIKNVFENLYLAEQEVSEFLADLKGITLEEFNNLEISKTLEIIDEFKNQEGIAGFFKSAGQSTK